MPKKTFSLAEIALHNSRESCWMALFGKVYDFTTYLDDHPGGDLFMLPGCGTDATSLFQEKSGMGEHTQDAYARMKQFYIGDLEGGEKK